jgi:hypothetical protein
MYINEVLFKPLYRGICMTEVNMILVFPTKVFKINLTFTILLKVIYSHRLTSKYQGRIQDLWLGGPTKLRLKVKFFWSDKNAVVDSKLSFK